MKFSRATFKMAAISANINFRVGSEASNFANDLNYIVSKFHAFTTFLAILLKTAQIDWTKKAET